MQSSFGLKRLKKKLIHPFIADAWFGDQKIPQETFIVTVYLPIPYRKVEDHRERRLRGASTPTGSPPLPRDASRRPAPPKRPSRASRGSESEGATHEEDLGEELSWDGNDLVGDPDEVPWEREEEELGFIAFEVSYGVKVSELLRDACRECNLDDTAYVLTFGDSDAVAHLDSDVVGLNCAELYLKNKFHLAQISAEVEATREHREDFRQSDTFRKRSSSTGSSHKADLFTLSTRGRQPFSKPQLFSELSDRFVPLGQVVLQINKEYILIFRPSDFHDPHKFSVFGRTDSCTLVDLGLEMPRVFGEFGPFQDFSRALVLRSDRQCLIFQASSEQEKKAWINVHLSYHGILLDYTQKSRQDQERETLEACEMRAQLERYSSVKQRVFELRGMVRDRATVLSQLLDEQQTLEANASSLLDVLYQELDLGKVRQQQVEVAGQENEGISSQLETIRQNIEANVAIFKGREKKLEELKELSTQARKVEVAKKGGVFLLELLIIIIFGWLLFRFL